MAAPTRVQSTGRVTASIRDAVDLPFATPPTVGNTIVVLASIFNTNVTSANTTCTDNRGNPYGQVGFAKNGAVAVAVFACTAPLVTGSPFTVTLHTTIVGSTFWEACALEVTGGVLAVDQMITQTGTSTTPATGTTAAVTGPDVFVVALHAINANQASITVQTVSPTWLEEVENLNNSATVASESDSRSLTGVGGTTQNCSWTDATLAAYAAAIVAFQGVGAAPPPVSYVSPYGVENIRVGIIGPNPEVP